MMRYLPIIVVLSLTSACVTTGRYDALEARVAALEHFKRDYAQLRKRDTERFDRLNKRIKQTKELIQQVKASLNLRLSSGKTTDVRLKGRLEELDFVLKRLSDQFGMVKSFLEKRFALTLRRLPPDVPKDAPGMLTYAKKLFKSSDYSMTRLVLKKLIAMHPQHVLLPDALLLVGDTHRMQRQKRHALKAYKEVFERYRKSTAAATALLHAGHTLSESGQCRKAITMYRFLYGNYPKSPHAKEARALVKSLKCR
jgi:TolA-binding protein